MSEQKNIDFIVECISLLEKTLNNSFLPYLDSPKLIDEPGKERFRFKNPTAHTFQILKYIRVVSGLNAAICLLCNGYVQELGVIVRTLIEFMHDTDFIQEGIEKGKLSSCQKKMLKSFFSYDIHTDKGLLSSLKKRPTIPRKKIYASISRLLRFPNLQRGQINLKAVEEGFSGYVHGSYSSIMELYGGRPGRFHINGSFHINGMLGTPRIKEWIEHLALFCVHPALNHFARFATSLGLEDVYNKLIEQRKKLEASDAYPNRKAISDGGKHKHT